MNILHIHQDYPDGRPYPFTKAVSGLISSCEVHSNDVKHSVLSVNRTSNPFNVSAQTFEQGISVVYWAIPLPIIYYWSMWLSALYINKQIKNLNVDLIHGHKLTSEGVLAYFLAKKRNKPYIISVRGGSDLHNITRLPIHKKFFAKVFNQATKVFWVSAWAKGKVSEILDINDTQIEQSQLLPNICQINVNHSQLPASQRQGYTTAISYHQYKRKGLVELIEAFARLNIENTSVELNVYGGGDDTYRKEIETLITEQNASAFIHLKGQVSQKELLDAMSHSKGFLMPAVNETFGMAYIEALSVGCPILYVENTGIDGYLDKLNVGEKLSTVNVNELVDAIQNIDNNNEALCVAIQSLQTNGVLSSFTQSQVSQQYITSITTH